MLFHGFRIEKRKKKIETIAYNVMYIQKIPIDEEEKHF